MSGVLLPAAIALCLQYNVNCKTTADVDRILMVTPGVAVVYIGNGYVGFSIAAQPDSDKSDPCPGMEALPMYHYGIIDGTRGTEFWCRPTEGKPTP